jgi:formiminoglutamase
VILSSPHGGRETPPEVASRVVASEAEVFDDSDAFTREIYDVGDAVRHVEAASVARAFVDLNRAPDDRPPQNPDGIVKTATCWGRPVYREPLDAATVGRLIELYHRPYHAELERASRQPGLWLGLDCHSMAEQPPPVAPDRGEPRPLFCLSDAGGATCDPGLVARLARALAEAFECEPEQVARNRPFQGGYLVRRHGRCPLPWIQVEMNRSLYLRPPWHAPGTQSVDPERLAELKGRFAAALERLAAGLAVGAGREPGRPGTGS